MKRVRVVWLNDVKGQSKGNDEGGHEVRVFGHGLSNSSEAATSSPALRGTFCRNSL